MNELNNELKRENKRLLYCGSEGKIAVVAK